MSPIYPKAKCQLLAWYTVPTTGYCRLVPLDADDSGELVACPTEDQQGLIVYPGEGSQKAGHFFASNDGRLFNLN